MAIRLNLTKQSQTTDQTIRSVANDVAGGMYGLSAADALAGLQTCADYASDFQLLEHARLVGIEMDKASIEDLRRYGVARLHELKRKQECAKLVASLEGGLSASAGITSALAGLQTCADYASDFQLLEHARLVGIEMDKASIKDLRVLGTKGLLGLKREQELAKLMAMASLGGGLSASAGITSALAGLTSTASATSALANTSGSISASTSVSDAMAAIARHSTGFESAWLSVHAGGVDQYAKELAHLIQPLASIREYIGTADGVLSGQFDRLAGTSTYLQASGVAADALLKFAWEPANRDAEPDVIAGRFMRTLDDGDGYTGIIPIQPLPAWVHSPVQPPAKADDEKRVESLKSKPRKSKAKRKKAEARANDAWAMVAKLSVALESMAVQVSSLTATRLPVAQAGAEIVQITIDPAMTERRMRVGEIQSAQPLERYSTIDHVTRWLLVATGRPWSLTELVSSLTPVIHLDRSSDLDAMFGKRLEGYLCPMVYEGDRQRLISSNEPLLTMTSLTDLDATARLIRFEPGIPFCRSEVRFADTDVESLAAEIGGGRTVPDVQMAKAPATPSNAIPSPDYAKLATRGELIEAFGKFTGMDAKWFDNLKDVPSLYAARKVTGQGGRNKAEPLFCPFEVLQWLLSKNRRKGKQMQPDTGWRMLEQRFPSVYNAHSAGDPRQD